MHVVGGRELMCETDNQNLIFIPFPTRPFQGW